MKGNPHSKRLVNRLKGTTPRQFLPYLVLLFGTFLIAFPIYWMVSSSFKTGDEVIQLPPTIIPNNPTLAPYLDPLLGGAYPWFSWFMNTAIVAFGTSIVVLLVAAPAAYSLAQREIPGERYIYYAFLSTLMIPPAALLLPLFRLFAAYNLLDSHLGLVLSYSAIHLGFAVFLLRGFFKTLPTNLEDAARIGGIAEWKIVLRIILPLAIPGLATTGLLVFVFAWKEFLFALTFLNSESAYTLSVGIQTVFTRSTGGFTNMNQLLAMSTFAVLPLFLLFAVTQDRFIKGITTGYEQ